MMQVNSSQSRPADPPAEPGTNIPLILVTNDDGIQSPGLRALVQAVCDLGDVIVAAPCRQFSNAGRSHPPSPARDRVVYPETLPIPCDRVRAYGLEGSPAQSVLRALVELVPRQPDLVISGINYGENVGSGVTISGTVGAALEAAAVGVPGLAVSLQTPHEFHYHPSDSVDFSVAAGFARRMARLVLAGRLPPDVDVLKVDVPDTATLDTPWRMTRVSRQRYYVPVRRAPATASGSPELNYVVEIEWKTLEPDSDIYALAVDRVVSVSPLSIDLTSRVDRSALAAELERRRNGHTQSRG